MTIKFPSHGMSDLVKVLWLNSSVKVKLTQKIILTQIKAKVTKNLTMAIQQSANSCCPFNRLQLKYVFAPCDPVTLTLTFWPNIKWVARTHDGLSLRQVWWLQFQPFWFYHADRHTHTHIHTDTQTDADECFTPTTLIGVSNYFTQIKSKLIDTKSYF